MNDFLSVFSGLNINENLKSRFKDVKVIKITRVLNGDFLRVYTQSEEPVPAEDKVFMEQEISTQLLGGMKAEISQSKPEGEAAKRDASGGDASNGAKAGAALNDSDYDYAESVPADKASAGAASKKPEDAPYAPGGSYSGYGKKRYSRKKKTTEKGMLYGRDFTGEPTPISDILGDMKSCIARGEVCGTSLNVTKNGTKIFRVEITDYKDTISAKLFLADGEEAVADSVKEGMLVRVKGRVEYDNFDGEFIFSHVDGIKPEEGSLKNRMDNAPEKRVELHLHTKYSDMDALTDIDKLLDRAAAWGHKAIAITDHGVVQAFPVVMHAAERVRKEYKAKGKPLDLKIIYGCEGYLVDDDEFPVLKDPEGEISLIRPVPQEPDDDSENGKKKRAPKAEKSMEGLPEEVQRVRKAKSYHIILLAANEIGRVNLYRLVSFAHVNYFGRRPKIPRSVLSRYREGIIVGSACVAGELYDGILSGKSDDELLKIASFYDYLEIQPVGNNAFLIRNYEKDRKGHKAKNVAEIQGFNKKVLELGDRLGKLVCATGDVHFLDPEDSIFRSIIEDAQKYEDADYQAPLYFHTTEEMLEEFSYLGDRAKEVVIDNPNKIAEMAEEIAPVRPDKCPPVIANSEKTLTDTVYERAHEMYGDPLPEIVGARLERELNSIISNGYAVLYIIAMNLVKKSEEDGYLVGSRGSVGSSLVATMAGITEVNPLKPHYRCEHCHYSEFDSEETAAYSQGAGCDMPDKKCPVCGELLVKDGFNIPFETFMGFKGDKEPDIDLNFSGEYQARAHAYTETLFEEGHTFRAGTISALQEKTVYPFVKKYFEKHGRQLRRCEINRLIRGCAGVKRSTGQHPGGIVVLPHGEEIYSFTPVQCPANDLSKGIITTHFEYHSIEHNLLKLDELGHDNPTIIKILEDLTGYSAKNIKLNDPAVMALFKGLDALNLKPEDIDGVELGTLGVPEFGTDFVIGMLKDTKPESFSDLVRIAGLSHGTDVWLSNAQKLIAEGRAALSECICTRDDIMTYLMDKGLEPSMAFEIMENVRKGKVAKGKAKEQWPAWEKSMKEHGVFEWYPWSCAHIQYMFPKAHAVAYVMMAFRIAYYKVFYPLAYYAAYYSIRASAFDYETMCAGREKVVEEIEKIKYRKQAGEEVPKDEDSLRDLRIVLEMYARGFEFTPIDLYGAKADRFQITDGKIMPSFTAIGGMGKKAAESLERAAAGERFVSKEDIKERTKISGTIVDKMEELGILNGLPASSQLSFADFFKM